MKLRHGLMGLAIGLSASAAFAQSAALKSPNVSANTLFLYQSSNFHDNGDDTSNRN